MTKARTSGGRSGSSFRRVTHGKAQAFISSRVAEQILAMLKWASEHPNRWA